MCCLELRAAKLARPVHQDSRRTVNLPIRALDAVVRLRVADRAPLGRRGDLPARAAGPLRLQPA
eukprot:974958-Pyramimonas_sp.AAC.1